jgi:hypothetical protein
VDPADEWKSDNAHESRALSSVQPLAAYLKAFSCLEKKFSI